MDNEDSKIESTVESVFTAIERYERDFIDKSVTIVDGYEFDQLNTIKRAHLYYNSKFESGDNDILGHKYFYPGIIPCIDNAKKNLNISTKDINIKSTKPSIYRRARLLRLEVREYMRKRRLGKKFNTMAGQLPKYGTVVVKKVKGKDIFKMVDLRNLKNDPTAECLSNSWVIEDHYYTINELRDKVADGWDSEEIEKAIKSFSTNRKENYVDNSWNDNGKGNAQYIRVREFYDNMPESWLDEEKSDSEKYVLGQMILVMPEYKSSDSKAKKATKTGLILAKNKVKKLSDIYKECHYDRTEGRWLGIGIIERNFDMIMLKNTQINLEVAAMWLANLVLFATDDKKFAGNILSELVNGDVVKLSEGKMLQRIQTEIRNNGGNQLLSQEIENIVNLLSNRFEATTGQSMPSGTPYSLGALINKEAMKLFEFIKEDFGLFLQEIFEDWVIPELASELTLEHTLEVTDKEELEWMMEEYKKHGDKGIWGYVKKQLMAGKQVTVEEVEMAEQILEERFKSKKSLWLDFPKDFYKDVVKNIEVIITGEQEDIQAKMITLSSMLQLIGGNKELINHPIFKELADLKGLSQYDLANWSDIKESQIIKAPVVQSQPAMAERGVEMKPIG